MSKHFFTKIDKLVHGWENGIPETFTGFSQSNRVGMTAEHMRAEICPHHVRNYNAKTGVLRCEICGRSRFVGKDVLDHKAYAKGIPVGRFPTKSEREIAQKKKEIESRYNGEIFDLRCALQTQESDAYKKRERKQLNDLLEKEGLKKLRVEKDPDTILDEE